MTTGRPGVTHLALPFDTQKAFVDSAEVWADDRHHSFLSERAAPEAEAVKEAASLLASAKSAIAICGGGPVLSGAFDALKDIAVLLGLPIATTVSGQGAIAETDPQALGVVGSNGGAAGTRAVVDAADVILFTGCRAGSVTTERWRSPSKGKTIMHIDSDPMMIGANYTTEVVICADARLALEALVLELNKRAVTAQNGQARSAKAWESKLEAFNALAASTQTPIRPEAVIASLMAQLDDDEIVVVDPGTPCPYFSAHYRWCKAGHNFITNRAHGALGCALAASMEADVGRPSAKTVAVMGDGSFGFCCGEFETIVRPNLPITTIVFSNVTFGWIKAGQDSGFGERYYNVGFNRTDHAKVAEAFGVKAWTVTDPADLTGVLKQALAHGGPTLVDVISQPLHEAAAPVSEWVA